MQYLICPPKFCITIVFHFSWVLQPSQKKFGGGRQTRMWRWCKTQDQIGEPGETWWETNSLRLHHLCHLTQVWKNIINVALSSNLARKPPSRRQGPDRRLFSCAAFTTYYEGSYKGHKITAKKTRLNRWIHTKKYRNKSMVSLLYIFYRRKGKI